MYIANNSTGRAWQHNLDITQCKGGGGGWVAKDSTHHVTTARRMIVRGNVPSRATADRDAVSDAF